MLAANSENEGNSMVKQKNSKTLVLLVLMLVVLGVVAWFGASFYATSKAEKQVKQLVQAMKLEDKLSWSSIKGTATGKVVIRDLSFNPEGEEELSIDAVQLNKFQDKDKRFEFDVDIKGIRSTSSNELTEMVNAYAHRTGLMQVETFDMSLAVLLDTEARTSHLDVALYIPKVLEMEFVMQADSAALFKRLMSKLSDAANGKSLSGDDFLSFVNLYDAQLEKTNFKIKDLGGFARQAELMKRYYVKLEQLGVDFLKQKEALFSAQLEEQQRECAREYAGIVSERNADKYCESIISFFAANKKKSIEIAAEYKPRVRALGALETFTEAAIYGLLEPKTLTSFEVK